MPRNIFYCREERPIYHRKRSYPAFFWADISCLEIAGVFPAAFHLVSGWIWPENDRKIRRVPIRNTASIFRAISGDFRPFRRNASENAWDPAVSDRTYLTWASILGGI